MNRMLDDQYLGNIDDEKNRVRTTVGILLSIPSAALISGSDHPDLPGQWVPASESIKYGANSKRDLPGLRQRAPA